MNLRPSEELSDRDHYQGRPDAPLHLLVYGDYACPYTQLAMKEVAVVRQRLGNSLCFTRAALSRIEGDPRSGEASGVRGTPTLFVNSRRHRGSYEAQALVDALQAAAAHGRR